MNNPLVTVIVPAYNHQDYLRTGLDSIKNQTYPNIEICIINDGSFDNTHNCIQDWINENPQMKVNFISRENRGITKTFNELVDMAEGQYIAVMASDDYILPDSIEKRVRFLQNNPKKLAVFGDCIVVDENNNKTHDSALFEYQNANKKKLLSECGIKEQIIMKWKAPGPGLLYDKKVFDAIGKYDESLLVEDWDFYTRLVSQNFLAFIDETVSAYRVVETSACRNPDTLKARHLEFANIARKNMKWFKNPYYKVLLFTRHLKYKKIHNRL